jgi:hypothetical protein
MPNQDGINNNGINRTPMTQKKILIGAAAAAVAALLVTSLSFQTALTANATNSNDPTKGYNIHVSVGRHDSAHLDAQMDHYCKLDSRIVAVCQLYATDNNANPGKGPQLAQIEFIITQDQYLQLPERERQNWHNHAVELTPERGNPSCIELPEGLTCVDLVGVLKATYGKVITIWDPADGLPDYPPYVFAVDSPFALGQDLNDNLHNEWPTSCGANSSASLSCEPHNGGGGGGGNEETATLRIESEKADGSEFTKWVEITDDSGGIVEQGFTPLEFEGEVGNEYTVEIRYHGNPMFSHWEDGSESRTRTLTLDEDMTLVATYGADK